MTSLRDVFDRSQGGGYNESPGANKAPGDWSRDAADYSLGEAAGLASFLAPFPAFAGFTSMEVAVIV
jgi:hypothetical protein